MVAVSSGVFEGVQPNVDTSLNVTKEVIKHHAANGQERNTDKNVACATCCYIEHDDKEHEEEQSATKVAFKNNNDQADAPHDKQGQQHFEARNAERSKRAHGD